MNIENFKQLIKVVSTLLERFPGAKGVLLQEQCSFSSEIILGGKHEPSIGQLILAGYGGTSVEIYKDISMNLTPVTASEAEGMLESLKCYKLLKGYRGKPGVNLSKLKEQLLRLSQMLYDLPLIAEMDLNPVIYEEASDSFKVLDCRIKI